MTEYIILALIMVFIYFVLIRNRPASKTDWETLPTLEKYQKQAKSTNTEGILCCQHCGHIETVEKVLISKKENPKNNKCYNACTNCKVILWRSEKKQANTL